MSEDCSICGLQCESLYDRHHVRYYNFIEVFGKIVCLDCRQIIAKTKCYQLDARYTCNPDLVKQSKEL